MGRSSGKPSHLEILFSSSGIADPARQNKYIIVCIDYLIKWDETNPVKEKIEQEVVAFLRVNIFYKFGYIREVVTDEGAKFTSNLIEDIMRKHHIKNKTFTSYYP